MNEGPKGRGDIAIVGMACLYPGADTPQRFWSNICAGLEFVGDPLPAWDADRYLGATGVNHVPTARGGYLGEAFAADPAELGVMPSSVDGSEPDQFLALTIAKAALADAGALERDHTRTGIILGHSTYLHRGNASVVQHGVVLDQTRTLLAQLLPGVEPALLDRVRAELEKRLPPFNADIAPGLVPNVMTGRIANRLDLRGPNYIIDAACSSSLLAVQAGMEELRSGRSDLMLVGGVNASISAEVYMVFHQLGALSRNGRVRPFCEGGDGTLLGEGLGVLALRRLEDAVAEGQRVYAVIKGIGQSSDGKGGGLLAPRLEGEMLAIQRALEDAGLPPEPPGLIEAHATGIPLGDRTEVSALRGVYGGRPGTGLPPTAIGSVKSMIGHPIPAAGAASLIKTALALHHRVLPPMLGGEPRAELGFASTPLYVSSETRPWIAPEGTRRRAAVNAFGFGGINAHAVLEEAPGPGGAPQHWPAELVLLSAGSLAELTERARSLAESVRARPDASLLAIAARAAATAGAGTCRLALVATDRDDLLAKLDQAAEKLGAGRGSFRTRSGVFAGDKPVEGQLAFVFPGEGAQYQGMLAEILMAFPEAREWFDFWDALFPDRDLPPSASVFPPPTTLDEGLRKALAARLFGLELGSESVFVAAQALMAVMRRIGLAPDVVVGHSSGEHSALAAAGVLGQVEDEAGRAGFAARIRSLNRLYREMEAAGSIPGGGLLTVGGVDRARILALVEADPDLHLALDNCRHQAVIYGPRPRMDEVAAALRAEGGITAFLPFDRPYHTPLFAPVAERVAEVYAGMGFDEPRLPIWSCATAAPMPSDPASIRALAAHQWASRVRFTETVERLHGEGVRLFLEIGPSANLTGFIDDALKGRGAVALALDSRRRGGLAYLLQSLGQVWVAGRDFDAAALFAGRGIEPVDLSAPAPRRKARFIDNTLPFIRLPDAVAAELSADLMRSLRPFASGDRSAAAASAAPALPDPLARVAVAAAAPVPASAPPPVVGNAALSGFFATMRQFLDTQGQVMEAMAGRAPDEATSWRPPLLHRVAVEDGRLRAESDFDPLRDPFIAQHVLYASRVSDLDDSLQALPVLPLAVSMEMVVEAAAVLTGAVASRLEAVRARDWVAFDDGPGTIVTEATFLPSGDRSRVAVRLLRGDSVLFEAEAVAGGEASLAPLPPLAEPRPAIWRDADLYTTGMFHGPLFQGVASLRAWDASGLDAVLGDLPLDGFFAEGRPDGLLLNPALLDQVGHVTAFWIAQGLGTDFSSFPSSIDRIDLVAPREEDTAGAVLSGRLSFRDAEDRPQPGPEGARFLEGDFDCLGADGRVLLRVRGWRDRFFRVPSSFYEARFRPREAWYGGLAERLFSDQPDDVLVWSVPAFPPGFLEDAGGLWTRVLAATVLSAREREQFRGLKGPGKRRREWLTGRIALKEAARAWILQSEGVACLPADIEIATEPGGKPYVLPDSLAALGLAGPPPEVTLAHAGGAALAAAGRSGRPLGIDMEMVGGVEPDLLAEGAFSAAERALLGLGSPVGLGDAGALTTGWCAKEAAAKALGQGLNGRPRAFVLSGLADGDRARIETPESGSVDVALARAGDLVMALAVV